eukprot:COSAG05_NODE_5113_length_1260_cov_1.465978_2_plen_58_part_01
MASKKRCARHDYAVDDNPLGWRPPPKLLNLGGGLCVAQVLVRRAQVLVYRYSSSTYHN